MCDELDKFGLGWICQNARKRNENTVNACRLIKNWCNNMLRVVIQNKREISINM
jgi:hypothetical protein